ncbi:hypothetical protein GGC64_006324 [Mycobacterium sp. OAS707]|nr:hypothetical protein [Mycobacterium sp. OAS707]MBE1552237.1 hypothetical protein [Mycobacterium sp. OAS707]
MADREPLDHLVVDSGAAAMTELFGTFDLVINTWAEKVGDADF